MKQNVFNNFILIFTGIIVITSIWNSIETRKLVEYEISPDIYFEVFPNIYPKLTYPNGSIHIDRNQFFNEPILNFKIINNGPRSITILNVYASGSCLNLKNDAILSIFGDLPPNLKPGDKSEFSYDFSNTGLNKKEALCSFVFELNTNKDSKSREIVLRNINKK